MRCDLADVLEAAHILPYHGAHTNHVQNGLLLRPDIHTLFDRGLIAVTREWTVVIAPQLASTHYGVLAGVKIALPPDAGSQPNHEAIDRNRTASGL